MRGSAGAVLACTLSPNEAECVRLPLVPVVLRVTVPVVAELPALKVKEAFAPGLTENGLAGLTVTPDGRLLRTTCTVPEKPFCGVTLTVTAGLVAPWETDIVEGDTVREKSGAGGGG